MGPQMWSMSGEYFYRILWHYFDSGRKWWKIAHRGWLNKPVQINVSVGKFNLRNVS